MKKIIALVLIGLAIAAHNAFGQTNTGLLNVNKYFSYFPIQKNEDVSNNDYVWAATSRDYDRFSILGGYNDAVDTPLEFALLSYYSPPVIKARPVEADAILPANDPKLADKKLGAAVMQDLQILRFLGNTAAVGRYEGMLKFITDRGNVTRAEVEKYYRDGIGAYISDAVEEQFNKISFSMSNDAIRKGYNVVLTRNLNGEYVLSYEGIYQGKEFRDKLTAKTPEALLAEMRKKTDEFDQRCVNTVRAQAALIPAVVYADWKSRGVANGVDGLALIKEALTNFYLNPNDTTYLAAYGIQLRYAALQDTFLTKGEKDIFAIVAEESYNNVVRNLNPALLDKFHKENRFSVAEARSVPNDLRYNVFSTRYAGGAKVTAAQK